MAIPKILYAIAYDDNWLQSTSYNSHYMIYRNRKNAEKALEKIKRKYSRSIVPLFRNAANKMRIVEYIVKE